MGKRNELYELWIKVGGPIAIIRISMKQGVTNQMVFEKIKFELGFFFMSH